MDTKNIKALESSKKGLAPLFLQKTSTNFYTKSPLASATCENSAASSLSSQFTALNQLVAPEV